MLKTYKWLFIAALIVFIAAGGFLPTNPESLRHYGVNLTQLRLAGAAIIVPMLAIYVTALYGFLRFYRYALRVRDSKEGPHLVRLAHGLMILAFSFPVTTALGSVSSYIGWRFPSLVSESVVLRNYIALLFAAAATYYIARGIQGLHATLKQKQDVSVPVSSVILPIAVASLFTWLLTFNAGGVPASETYHLPGVVLIATIAVPYTYVWTVGIRAALQLYEYQRAVQGKIYRDVLRNVALGVGMVIAVSAVIQLASTLVPQLEQLKLASVIVLVYVLLVLYAAGYGLVARGAKRLHKIEEV